MAHPHPGPFPPERKKLPVWLWVVIGICSFVIIAVAGVAVAGYYVVKKFAENPQAVIDTVVANNPGIEVVSRDDAAGKLVLRDRRDGKEFTIDYEDAKRGRIHIDAGGKRVDIRTGARGIEVRDGNSTARAGAGAGHAPAWVPAYPGSSPQGGVTRRSEEGSSEGTVSFRTRDTGDKVLDHYESTLRQSGYTVQRGGRSLSASSGKRTLEVKVHSEGILNTQATVTYNEAP